MPIALVRRPGPSLADGLVSNAPAAPVDAVLAAAQWDGYVSALAGCGWSIIEVESADEFPDAVFIEDAIVVFDELAVITRPGAVTRRGETISAERAAFATGLEVVNLTRPATLDGGDVLKVGRTVYVGLSGRTNQEGIDQLAAVVSPRGWTVVGVPVTRVLHLKSAVTALPDGTVVGHPDHVDDPGVFDRFLAVPEPAGAHVVLLGDDRLLMAAGAPATAELYRSMGYLPVEVDISEFEKLDGCVTCLSVRLRGVQDGRHGVR